MLKKFIYTAAMAATSYVGDSPLFLFDYLLRLLRVAVMLSLWRTLFGHSIADPNIASHTIATHASTTLADSAMPLPLLLTYTLMAEVFAEQLAPATNVVWSFWDGSIATRFSKPMGVFTRYIAEACGKWAFNFTFFSVPLLVLGGLMGVSMRPASLLAAPLALVSLGLGIAIGLALEFFFTAVAIGLQYPPFALDRVRGALASLASGAVIPLALLPWGIGGFLAYLPFASIASAPLRLYTGTGTPQEVIPLQLFWALLLWPLTLWLWRLNSERMVSYGG